MSADIRERVRTTAEASGLGGDALAGQLLLGDQLAQNQRQDAAVVHVADLGVVVDARVRLESGGLAIVRSGYDLDRLAGLDRVDPADGESLATCQPEPLRVLPLDEHERQDAHADQVPAV